MRTVHFALMAALAVAGCDTKAKVDTALDKANKALDEIPKLAKGSEWWPPTR